MDCDHRENTAGAEVCARCGTSLKKVCRNCGESLPIRANFCLACGQDLSKTIGVGPIGQRSPGTEAPETPADQGERRQATILYSDLCGYTAMNGKLDPEEVEAIMRRIKEGAVRIVECHGGIVNQFVGDEVLALFGISTAHEDDPVRAVTSAFELHDLVQELSLEVESRIGQPLRMHTGIWTDPLD